MTWRACAAVGVTAVALFLAPGAQAKGPIVVCGSTGCARVMSEAALASAARPIRLFGVDSATPTRAPISPTPYFVLRFSDFPGPLAFWIPARSTLLLRPQEQPQVWLEALPREVALLREKTAGLRPYRAPKHAVAFVDDELVPKADSYLRLFAVGTRASSASVAATWLPVRVTGGQTPWNDGRTAFWVARRGGLLKRDGVILSIPIALAQRIRSRVPLR
jgi:hypothetical protein